MCDSYKMMAAKNKVEALSKSRIPYNRKACSKFRENIRCVLSELKPAEGWCVYASYQGPDMGAADLDNILFYNMGYTPAGNRVFAEKSSTNETDTSKEFPHRYVYEVRDYASLSAFWEKDRAAAKWDSVPIPSTRSPGTADYWQALRKHPDKIQKFRTIGDSPFGVRVTLFIPPASRMKSLTSDNIKHLLDGVICAFHGADKQLEEMASDILNAAPHLTIPESQFLCSHDNILGNHSFIRRYGKGIQWNPQDHRCQAFDIEFKRTTGEHFLFSGELYQLSC